MTGRFKALVLLLMLAVLSTCVLSTSVISGEHPWDSDQRPDSTGTLPPETDTISVTTGTTARTGSGSTTAAASSSQPAYFDWFQRVVYKLALEFAQRYHPVGTQSNRADRW